MQLCNQQFAWECCYLESSFGDVEPILKCPAFRPSALFVPTAAPGMFIAALTADDRIGDDDAALAAAPRGLPVRCGLELRLLCGLKIKENYFENHEFSEIFSYVNIYTNKRTLDII